MHQYLFDSIKGASIMKCGHTMHTDCFDEMAEQNQLTSACFCNFLFHLFIDNKNNFL